MPQRFAASFATRRDAEMAVEHIVQEHGLDRNAVVIRAASQANSAGTAAAGSDLEAGHAKQTTGEPELAGRFIVSVEADEALADEVHSSFSTYGGERVET